MHLLSQDFSLQEVPNPTELSKNPWPRSQNKVEQLEKIKNGFMENDANEKRCDY